MTTGVEVAVLGPMSVRVHGAELTITQDRSRQLLALLAARSGHTWGWRELVDELWPDSAPTNPRQTLQVSISRLRTALGAAADRLATDPGGYRLEGVDVDAVRFGSLVAGIVPGSVKPSIGCLEEAAALWRGEPLADIRMSPALESWAGDLAEHRSELDALLIEAYVLHRRFDDAVRIGRVWFGRDDTDERAATALAVALARRGNKSEGLRTIDRLREALRNELGVDASQAVNDVERSILHGTVDLMTAETSPRDGTAFVVRTEEVERLAGDRRQRLMVVVGPLGIGKSELLNATAAHLAERGVATVTCQVSPLAQGPLEPVRSVIASLHELGAVADGPVVAWSHDQERTPAPANTRDELIEVLAATIDDGTSQAGCHLMIDDAHWLDRTSHAVLRRVVELDRACLTISARPDADDDVFWKAMVGDLQTLHMRPFNTNEVGVFLSVNHPRLADSATATRLHRRSGGNPLFLALLADGVEEGSLVGGDLPISILMAAAERLDTLPSPVRRTVDIAAVVGDEFDLATVAALDVDAVPNLLVAAKSGVVEVAGVAGSFAHGVIADAARQLLTPVRRLDLHDAVGTLLRDVDAPATAYARHFEHAFEIDPLRAIRATVAAGDEYLAAYDHDGAAQRFARADDLLARVTSPPLGLAAIVKHRRGVAERRLGDAAHVDHLLEAAELSREAGDRDLFFDAVAELCRHGGANRFGDVDTAIMDLLIDALSSDPPPEIEARLCAAATTLLSFSPQSARGRELFHSAWTTVQSLADLDLEAAVLMNAHLGLCDPNDIDDRDRAASRLAELSGGDVDRRWEAEFLAFTQALIHANGRELERSITVMRELHLVPKDQPKDFGMAFCEAAYSVVHDQLEVAEEHANHVLAIGTSRYSPSWSLATYAALTLAIKDAAGEVAGMAALIERASDHVPDAPNVRSVLALSLALQGERRRAVEVLRALVSVDGTSLSRDLSWSGSLALLARAAVITGDTDSMAAIRPILEPWSSRMAFMGVATLGPADEALALLAWGLEDVAAAEMHAARARFACERLGATTYLRRVDAVDRTVYGR